MKVSRNVKILATYSLSKTDPHPPNKNRPQGHKVQVSGKHQHYSSVE